MQRGQLKPLGWRSAAWENWSEEKKVWDLVSALCPQLWAVAESKSEFLWSERLPQSRRSWFRECESLLMSDGPLASQKASQCWSSEDKWTLAAALREFVEGRNTELGNRAQLTGSEGFMTGDDGQQHFPNSVDSGKNGRLWRAADHLPGWKWVCGRWELVVRRRISEIT